MTSRCKGSSPHGSPRTGWDRYRRFIDMFGNVVMGLTTGLTHDDFEEAMTL